MRGWIEQLGVWNLDVNRMGKSQIQANTYTCTPHMRKGSIQAESLSAWKEISLVSIFQLITALDFHHRKKEVFYQERLFPAPCD